MVNPRNFVNLPAGVGGLWLAAAIAANAQVVPDTTVNTVVTPNGNTFTIDGGTTAGSNLFHSFSEFSLPTGSEAFFNNAASIDNILTRVTGGSISNIDGLIRANGTANLFLLNPNGIVFGPNASLDLGGSFLASSADAVQFGDGIEFSASDTNSSPLLSVNVPVGLQFGRDPGSIINRSTVNRGASVDIEESVGLSVQPGRTLALVGGEVRLEAEGSLTAPGGRIELGGVGNRQEVGIDFADGDFALDYNGVRRFADVVVSGGAIVNSSGDPNGPIHIQANTLQLDNSRMVAFNLGAETGGEIDLRAARSIEIVGETAAGFAQTVSDFLLEDNFSNNLLDLPGGIFAFSVDRGTGGRVTLNAREVNFSNSAFLATRADSVGRAGDIDLNADRAIEVDTSMIISTSSFASTGNSGDITANTGRLSLPSGRLVSEVFGPAGNSGNVTVNATQSVEILGVALERVDSGAGNAFIGTGTESGIAGDVRISTGRLSVSGGGAVLATAIRGQQPGNIYIDANTIELSGTSLDASAFPSSIFAGSFVPTEDSVAGGNITIDANRIRIRDGASIFVQNFAPGEEGNLDISARSIRLDGGSITTATVFGEAGNITVDTNALHLNDGSQVSTIVGGATNPVTGQILIGTGGNGGNISIDTNALIARNNSDIFTDVLSGSGGNISIEANAINGIEFRENLTPNSDIATISTFDISSDPVAIECDRHREMQVASKVANDEEGATASSAGIEEASHWFVDDRGAVTLASNRATNSPASCQ